MAQPVRSSSLRAAAMMALRSDSGNSDSATDVGAAQSSMQGSRPSRGGSASLDAVPGMPADRTAVSRRPAVASSRRPAAREPAATDTTRTLGRSSRLEHSPLRVPTVPPSISRRPASASQGAPVSAASSRATVERPSSAIAWRQLPADSSIDDLVLAFKHAFREDESPSSNVEHPRASGHADVELSPEEVQRRAKILEGLHSIAHLDAQLVAAARKSAALALQRARERSEETRRLEEVLVRQQQQRLARMQRGMRGESVLAPLLQEAAAPPRAPVSRGNDDGTSASVATRGSGVSTLRARATVTTDATSMRPRQLPRPGPPSSARAAGAAEAAREAVDTTAPPLRKDAAAGTIHRAAAASRRAVAMNPLLAAEPTAPESGAVATSAHAPGGRWAIPRAAQRPVPAAVDTSPSKTHDGDDASHTAWPTSPLRDHVSRNIELAATYMPTRRLLPAEEARLRVLLGELHDDEDEDDDDDGDDAEGKDSELNESKDGAHDVGLHTADGSATAAVTPDSSRRRPIHAGPVDGFQPADASALTTRPTTAASAVSSLASEETSATAAQARAARATARRRAKQSGHRGGDLGWEPDIFGGGFVPEGMELERLRTVEAGLADMVQRGAASDGAAAAVSQAALWPRESTTAAPPSPASATQAADTATSPGSAAVTARPSTVASTRTDAASAAARPGKQLKLLPFFITALDDMAAGASVHAPASLHQASASVRSTISAATAGTRQQPIGPRSVAPATTSAASDGIMPSVASIVEGDAVYGDAVIAEQRRERLLRQRMALIDVALHALHTSIPGGHSGMSVLTQSQASNSGDATQLDRPVSPNSITSHRTRSSLMSTVTVTKRLTAADINAEVSAAAHQLHDTLAPRDQIDALLRDLIHAGVGDALPAVMERGGRDALRLRAIEEQDED